MSIDGLRREFVDPGNEFRFAPFWFINHELTEEETRWQVREMNRQGVGGFIYHPRHGLLTEYMSEEYLDNVAAAIDEARTLGMKAYLYDENNWPSGPADAEVFDGHPEYRMSGARLTDRFDLTPRDAAGRELTIGDELIAVIGVPLEGGEPAGFPQSAVNLADAVEDGALQWSPSRGEGDWRVYVISRRWHVGTFFGSYLDTLNPDAVRRFIDLTHEKYRERFEEHFGGVVDGIFTDEPSMDFNPPDCIPWTARLPGEFEWRKNYSLLTGLPALFEDMGPETTRVRCDFWDAATDVYVNAFFRQIYEWCDDVRLNLIGHVNREGEITYHCREQGDWFRVARYMHWGGCDYLRENTWPVGTEMYNVLAAGKFASSGAHLLGKRIVGCECFGLGSQWAIDLRNLKWMSDFALALGINQLEPHAFYYSIQGFRKWECPPGEFYQSPFWAYYDALADYVGRLSAVLRDGQHIADVAHFYPNRSFHAEMDPFENDRTEQLRRSFLRCGRLLLKINADFDYVSEEMLQRADFDGGEIAVNYPDTQEVAERYRVLVMPACSTMSRHTADALRRFVSAGGRIIALGELPTRSVEGGEDEHVRDVMEGIFGEDYERSLTVAGAEEPVVGGELAPGWRGGALIGYPFEGEDDAVIDHLAQAFEAAIDPDVRVREADDRPVADVVHYHYEREDRHFFLLQNTSREDAHEVTVTLRMSGDVEVWDPEDGSVQPALIARGETGQMHLPLRLAPTQSTLLCVDPSAQCPSTPVIDADLPLVSVSSDEVVGLTPETGRYAVTIGSHDEPRVIEASVRAMPDVAELDDEWEFETATPNALPLSRWEYDMNYWVVNTDADANEHVYRARFSSDLAPEEARLLLDGLAVDTVWKGSTVVNFEVLVNGDVVARSRGGRGNLNIEGMEPGEHLDHYIYEADIDGLIVEGPNVVEVRTHGQLYETPNLGHPVIILGRFAVGERDSAPLLMPEPTTIDGSGWDEQGYEYFSGIGVYRQKVRLTEAQRRCRLTLEMDQPGDLVEVVVNGRSCGVRAWEPWAVDVTNAISGPTNEVELRVANSLQNLLVQEPKPSGVLGRVRIVPRKELVFKR